MSKKKRVHDAHLTEGSRDDERAGPARRPRRTWSNNWSQLRETDSFCVKLVELRADEPEQYRSLLRMTAEQFDRLLGLVTPLIQKNDTHMRKSIPASERLALTLRFLATGANFRSLQGTFRIPQTTISRIIPEVLDAIYNVLVEDFIKAPQTESEWLEIARKFEERWQIPNCIGVLDGKHVVIVASAIAGEAFYNYKGTHSILLMAIADADYKLLYIDVGRSGQFSDGGAFNRCTFARAIASNQLHLPEPKPLRGLEKAVPYMLVADDSFATHSNVLKPYAERNLSSMPERALNYRLKRTRRVINNVFGVMSGRFRVLQKPIHLDPIKTKKVVLACCVLHNYLMETNKAKYAPATSFDQYDDEDNITTPADWRSDENDPDMMFPLEAARNNAEDDKDVRNEFAEYCIGEGDVAWQYKHL